MLHAKTTIRPMEPADADAIASLHARAFGPGRFTRTAYRVREGAPERTPYCRGAITDGNLVAAVRFTGIHVGKSEAGLLLGPLVVDPDTLGQGLGSALVDASLDAARAAGLAFVVLVGDMPFYGRFGFEPVPPGKLTFPGPVDPARILAMELQPGALEGLHGVITAG